MPFPKHFNFAKNLAFKMFLARFISILFFVAFGVAIKFDKGQVPFILFIAAVINLLITVIIYLWAGWLAVKARYSIRQCAEVGALIGFCSALVFSAGLGGSSGKFLLNMVSEIFTGVLFTVLGAWVRRRYFLQPKIR